MVAFVLTCARLDPTSVIGGRVHFLESHARLGQGRYMVCEADEFDRSFLSLRPVWVVITNIEAEHLDCYGSLGELEQAFATFASRVPFYGSVVACADDPGVRRVLEGLSGRVVTYGLSGDAWLRAVDLEARPTESRFSVCAGAEMLGEIVLPMPGEHNVSNALAAIALGLELGLELREIGRALASFTGVARRFQVLGEAEGVTVVDDYAHHPTEIIAAIEAGRQAFAGRRLLVAFQPHLYSRTRDLSAEIGAALARADGVMVLPVYAARERSIEGVDSALVVDAVRAGGQDQVWEVEGFEEAFSLLRGIASRDDVMLTLGAGDVNKLAFRWLEGA
jgi:UDP-N-acetylmuramate--alanine ligase